MSGKRPARAYGEPAKPRPLSAKANGVKDYGDAQFARDAEHVAAVLAHGGFLAYSETRKTVGRRVYGRLHLPLISVAA